MSAPNASFPKPNESAAHLKQKLRRTNEFLEVFKKGRSVREAGVALYVLKNLLNQNRLGIVVSRKAMPRAVDRNRAKRIVREFFRARKNRLRTGNDLVVRFIDGSKQLKNNELRIILENLSNRLDLISESEPQE